MKLLLTSSGLTNKSIVNALCSLTGKKTEETSLVFIPTASTIETGDKGWFIDDLIKLKKQNFKSIEITDISAVDEEIWKPSLERCDVLYFEGGNTYHLMHWLSKTGLTKMLTNLLKDKVYVGSSAGSMVTGKNMAIKQLMWLYEEDTPKGDDIECLNFTDFYFFPHLNSPYFESRKEDFMRKVLKDRDDEVYVADDDTALKVVDGKVEVVSEGEWFKI